MDLRAAQKPLKDRYRHDASASRVTLVARGGKGDVPIACSVDVGRTIYAAEAHPGVGGAGTAACSGDLLLGALAACAQLTCQMVASAIGIRVDDVQATVEGELDLAGTLGIRPDARVGFDAIRLRFDVDAPEASESELRALLEKTERYCVVLQTLADPPPTEVTMSTAARS